MSACYLFVGTARALAVPVYAAHRTAEQKEPNIADKARTVPKLLPLLSFLRDVRRVRWSRVAVRTPLLCDQVFTKASRNDLAVLRARVGERG